MYMWCVCGVCIHVCGVCVCVCVYVCVLKQCKASVESKWLKGCTMCVMLAFDSLQKVSCSFVFHLCTYIYA